MHRVPKQLTVRHGDCTSVTFWVAFQARLSTQEFDKQSGPAAERQKDAFITLWGDTGLTR